MEPNEGKAKTNTTLTIIEEKKCPPSESTKEAKEVNYDMVKPWEKASKAQAAITKGSELFVGNLSVETTEEDIFTAFQPYGEVIDIRIHKNAQTKKCYAFVRFATKEMTQKAFELNLTMLKGRRIKITKSNENSTIFIGNIRKTWTNAEVEMKVRRIFHNVGKIEHFPDVRNQNKNRGFCFAIFNNRNEAIKALNYVASKGGINIDGIPLTCDWADVVDDDESDSKQIFISGLNECIEEPVIRDLFKAYGKVTNVVLSKNHLNSKRKDLAFITFETHAEAVKSIELFNKETELKESLGTNVTASIAFSQQAMQTKKKIKDSRKKVTQISSQMLSNNANVNQVPEVDQDLKDNTQLLNQNVNATAMLAMMNFFNMNRANPNMLSQVMTACLGSMLNTPQTEVQTQQGVISGKNPTSYAQGYYSNQQGFNSELNPQLSSNPQMFLNNKRPRTIPPKRTGPISSSPNPQSSDLTSERPFPFDSYNPSSPHDNM